MRVWLKLADNKLLRFFILIILYALGMIIFSNMEGAGPMSAFFFVGESILKSDISSQADSIVNLIFNFIITTMIYYFISLIITYVILKIWGR